MLRSQYILSAAALTLVLLLWLLPKGVLKKEGQQVEQKQSANTASKDLHQVEFSAQEQAQVLRWKEAFTVAQASFEARIWADSLYAAYTQVQRLDSAAGIMENLAQRFPSDTTHLLAAQAHFEAFRFMLKPETVEAMAGKAQQYYQLFLDAQGQENSTVLDARANLAMTYMRSPNPMQGVAMLRENLDKDPKHLVSLQNMGLLAMESGQFDKAVGYFERVVEIIPDDLYAQFSLASSLMQAGKKQKAKPILEKIVDQSTDPALINAANSYLGQL
jgi:outer membrane protein